MVMSLPGVLRQQRAEEQIVSLVADLSNRGYSLRSTPYAWIIHDGRLFPVWQSQDYVGPVPTACAETIDELVTALKTKESA